MQNLAASRNHEWVWALTTFRCANAKVGREKRETIQEVTMPVEASADGAPPADPTADAELRDRFDRDVTPHIATLYHQAFRVTHNHTDAEDLVQDALVKAFIGFHSFRQDTNLSAWLHRILINTFISAYRKKQRRPIQHSTEDISDQQLAVASQHSATGLRSAEDHALEGLPDNDIRTAMRALPEQFRVAVYYADVEGYSFREIANLTDAPFGTVTSRLHRGRHQLRRLLAEHASVRSVQSRRELCLDTAV
jgi:RNA polymerase sigma-70 factor, ECF subfamily